MYNKTKRIITLSSDWTMTSYKDISNIDISVKPDKNIYGIIISYTVVVNDSGNFTLLNFKMVVSYIHK